MVGKVQLRLATVAICIDTMAGGGESRPFVLTIRRHTKDTHLLSRSDVDALKSMLDEAIAIHDSMDATTAADVVEEVLNP